MTESFTMPTLTEKPSIKWFWQKSEHPLMFRFPEEVETWHPSVAYPTRQANGCFTRILWPYGCLYDTEEAALTQAIRAQQQIVIEATQRLDKLSKRLALVQQEKSTNG